MSDRIEISFIVRDKGGPAGGKTLTGAAPAFEWENFKNTPNAEAFVKKAYIAACRKVIREIDSQQNRSDATDLASLETVIAKSLSFTKEEIRDWIKTRDWSRASEVRDVSKLLPEIEKKFPALASRINPFPKEHSDLLAVKVVAAVADKADAVADYLFTVLTTPKTSITAEDL